MVFRRFRPPLVLSFLGLFGLVGLIGIGVIAGASITANRGAPVSLGAGYASVGTACDENVTVRAQTAPDPATGQLYVATIALSDISQNATTGCGQKIIEAALKINGQVIYTSWSIPTAVSDSTFFFGGATNLVNSYYANTALSPFQADGFTNFAITQIGSWIRASISVGGHHLCVISSTGAAKCWGANYGGELGDGTTTTRLTPVNVSGLSSGVAAISAGNAYGSDDPSTCAVTSTGAAKCWGNNGKGQLGNGTTTASSTPVDVTGLSSGVAAISNGKEHACALLRTGAVKCWGENQNGQLGDGTTADRLTPVDVTGLSSGVTAISTGKYFTCALLSTGGMKCWGHNGTGALGYGNIGQDYSTPGDVTGLTSGVTAISAVSQHTCAVLSTGAAKCWGYNASGQLGDGLTSNSDNTPGVVTGLSSGVTAISTGTSHTCAILTTGAAKCWGSNGGGRLGDGSITQRLTPVDVSGLSSGVNAIGGGNDYTCALLDNGGIKCWGANADGQIGDGTRTQRLTPTAVVGLP